MCLRTVLIHMNNHVLEAHIRQTLSPQKVNPTDLDSHPPDGQIRIKWQFSVIIQTDTKWQTHCPNQKQHRNELEDVYLI